MHMLVVDNGQRNNQIELFILFSVSTCQSRKQLAFCNFLLRRIWCYEQTAHSKLLHFFQQQKANANEAEKKTGSYESK